MKTPQFPQEKLQEIRELLPWGSQTEIARRLSTFDNQLTPQVVSKVLRNFNIRRGKCDPMAVIMEAVKIIEEVNKSKTDVVQAVDAILNTTKQQ